MTALVGFFLFRSLLGCYADSTADRGGIDLAAAGTLYIFAYRSGCAPVGLSNRHPAGELQNVPQVSADVNPHHLARVLAPSLIPSTID